jgi:methionine synthase II (cobalamin-independent)
MITKEIYVEDLIKDYPQTVSLLTRRGIICIQCGEPVWGTLGEALKRAGIEDEDELVGQLNAAVSKV